MPGGRGGARQVERVNHPPPTAAGKINIAASSSHTLYSNAGNRTRTLNPLDELEVSTFPFGPVYLAFLVRPTA